MTTPSSGKPASALARIWRSAEFVSRAAVWCGGALMIASTLFICFDVFARKFLQLSTNGSNELSGYAFAISTAWALAFTMLERVNVRVDVLYRLLPARVSAFLDWLSVVAMGIFMAYVTWYGFGVAQTSWIRDSAANTSLGTPLWIPQSLWVIGLIWMCVVLVLMLLRASIALVTGDLVTIRALCGQRTSEEEAHDEARSGERIARAEHP